MVHVGIGYGVHQLVTGRKLILGGVEIPARQVSPCRHGDSKLLSGHAGLEQMFRG